VVGEICANSKERIAVVAGDSKVGENARRAGHAVATRLVADVRDVYKMYHIVRAKRINTKFGSTFLLSIRDSEAKIVKIFLSKRYGDVVSDGDMNKINSKTVSQNLIFKGICDTSLSFLMAIVS